MRSRAIMPFSTRASITVSEWNSPFEMRHVPFHVLRIDEQPVDKAVEPRKHVIDQDRAVRYDDALDRGMTDVALVPQRHILHGRQSRSTGRRVPDRKGSRQRWDSACAALPRIPSALPRNTPLLPALRSSADAEARRRISRSKKRSGQARTGTRHGGRAGRPGWPRAPA